jgi:hypothetical protein
LLLLLILLAPSSILLLLPIKRLSCTFRSKPDGVLIGGLSAPQWSGAIAIAKVNYFSWKCHFLQIVYNDCAQPKKDDFLIPWTE